MTTARNLCRPEESRAYFGPLMDIAQTTSTSFLCHTHRSLSGDALGRRFVGAVRVLWKMSDPDPEGQPGRRRLWVDKSYGLKPPPLGMTIRTEGCDFNDNPPEAPPMSKGGRHADAREPAEKFIRESLQAENDQQATKLAAAWLAKKGSKSAFWRARDVMLEAGELICEGRPYILHLIATDS